MAFRKIRINKKKHLKPIKTELAQLINQRNILKKNLKAKGYQQKIEDLEDIISKKEAEENRKLVMKNFKRFNEDPENVNLPEVWKLLNNICPKFESSIPIAQQNHKGVLVSNPNEIKKLLAKEYGQRLRPRPARPDFGDLKERKDEIFMMHMKLAEECTSCPWKMSDLDRALSDLKNNKSRDHAGYCNEIFKKEAIGSDL